MAASYGYSDILLFSDGRPVVTLREPATAAGNTTRAVIAQAAAGASAVMSNFYRGADSAVKVDIARAVGGQRALGAQGTRSSATVIVLRAATDDYLYPLFRYWPSPSRTAATQMLRQDGENVVVLNEKWMTARDSVATNVLLTRDSVAAVRAAKGLRGRFEGPDHRGVQVLADLRGVAGAPWIIVTKMDESEVLEVVRGEAGVIAVVTALSILLVGLFAALGYRQRQATRFRELYDAERREREAEAAFRTTLYSIGEAVVTTDLDNRVTCVNRVAERLTGWTDAEARGKALADVYRAGDDGALRDRDDVVRPVASSTAPIVDATGTRHGTVLVIRDQTDERVQQARSRGSCWCSAGSSPLRPRCWT